MWQIVKGNGKVCILDTNLTSEEAVGLKAEYFTLTKVSVNHPAHTSYNPHKTGRTVSQNCNGLGGKSHTEKRIYSACLAYSC